MRPGQLSDHVISKIKWVMRCRFANERGVALPLVLLVVALLAFMGMHATFSAISEASMVRNYEDGVRAFYLAERGLNEAIAELMDNGAFIGNIPADVSTVTYASGQTGRYIATVELIDGTTFPRTVHVVAAAEVGQVRKFVEITADISSQRAGNLTFAKFAVYGDDIRFRTQFSLSSLLAAITGGHFFGVNGNVYANNNAYFGPLYRVNGSVNTGGEITLDSLWGFGRAVISDTEHSHEYVNPDDYDYSFPQVDVDAYLQAADVIFPADHPAMVTDKNGRRVLQLDKLPKDSLSGIVYVEGDIIIDSSKPISGDVTFFARNGNISIVKPSAIMHRVGLVASRPLNPQDPNFHNAGNVDLGGLSLFGNAEHAVFIHAEKNITGSINNFTEALVNYRSLNGTIIGRTIDLANIRVNYNSGIIQNGENGPAAPPLPEHFGTASGRVFCNWADVGILPAEMPEL